MAQSMEESLLQAIKKDDIRAFNGCMEKAPDGAYRLGRFPVLSLLYLYRARKLLSAYEGKLLKLTDYKELREPAEVSKKFSLKAGKCLRLYFHEFVSPLEMLLILDKTKHLKAIFPFTEPSEKVKQRLQLIYSIKYSLNVQFKGYEIVIDKRPLSYREKKKIATVCLCSALAVALAIAVPVTAVALTPKAVDGEVTRLRQINFTSFKEYTLKQDIVLPENYSAEKVNCTINGGGHKLIFSKGASFGEFNGKLSDIVIESSGDVVLPIVSEAASVQNVTVHVNADAAVNTPTSLFAGVNFGLIDGVTLNVSGRLNALAGENDGTDEFVFGGFVMNNAYKLDPATLMVYNGVIRNCTVNYSQLRLVGETGANAMFGGVAGINGGYLMDCTVSGEIIADTFDVAGVCALNSGMLSDSVNAAKLSQISSDTSWNPIVSGIVLRNYSAVQGCENKGSISAVSACEQSEEGRELTVTAAGLVYLNGLGGLIERSKNSGSVTAEGSDTAFAGGICAVLYAQISSCLSCGEIFVTAKKVYAGGIFASGEVTPYGGSVYFGVADSCISRDKISVTVLGGEPACVGGIAGRVCEYTVNSSLYVGGGVTNCYFTGECVSKISYFGNIVGVCGVHIYESNSYYATDGKEYHNFEDNRYAENAFRAFGAIVTEEEDYADASDKGAASMSLEEIEGSEEYQKILSEF